MMNSLDEAIKYCEEVAEDNESDSRLYTDLDPYIASECDECANEHRQLAEWLKELKAYKELNTYNRKNPCSECKHEDSAYNCDYCIWKYVNYFEQKEVNTDGYSN